MTKRLVCVLLSLIILVLQVPAAMAVYDLIIVDDIEGFDLGDVPSNVTGWGNNSGIPISVADDGTGNKAVLYEGSGDYAKFRFPAILTGKVSASLELYLPEKESFTDFRISLLNEHAGAIGFLQFQNDGKLRFIRGTTSTSQYLTVCSNLPFGRWFSLQFDVDTDKQEIIISVDGTRYETVYPFRYKYAGSAVKETLRKANFREIRFANRNNDNAKFMLDNFSVSYIRDITDGADENVIIEYGDTTFDFPAEVTVTTDDGAERTLEVDVWTLIGDTELDVNTPGEYKYQCSVVGHKDILLYNFIVSERDRVIESISDIYESLETSSGYELPEYVEAIMSDGLPKKVPVEWESETFDSNIPGNYVIQGTVVGYGNVSAYIDITAKPVKLSRRAYVGIKAGDALPEIPGQVEVRFEDNSKGMARVEWEPLPQIDINKPGIYRVNGSVIGSVTPAELVITVYEYTEKDEERRKALVTFYDNILNYGRDNSLYSPSMPNVLFANGINVRTNEQFTWRFPGGKDIYISSPAAQHILYRSLDYMTQLSGDEKYRDAAKDAIAYLFDHFTADNGLIKWGGHSSIDLSTYTSIGENGTEEDCTIHELKDHFLYFDMMYDVNPEATERYIKSIWLAHFKDWDDFYFNRHAKYTYDLSDWKNVWHQNESGDPDIWQYPSLPVDAKGCSAFLNAAEDYMYAATFLAERGDKDALTWIQRLQNMYLYSRNPVTGLMPFMYAEMSKDYMTPDLFPDDFDLTENTIITGRTGDTTQNSFPSLADNPYCYTYSSNIGGDYTTPCYATNPVFMLRIAEFSDEDDREFYKNAAREVMEAFIDYSYVPTENTFNSVLGDGTVLTGYKSRRYYTYVTYGGVTGRNTLSNDYIYSAAKVYNATKSPKIWEFLRSLCDARSIGDIGTAPGVNSDLNYYTQATDPKLLLGLIELYKETFVEDYLKMARKVGNNIIAELYKDGYFVSSSNNKYSEVNNMYAYALIALETAVTGQLDIEVEYYSDDALTHMYNENSAGTTNRVFMYKLFREAYPSETTISKFSFEKEHLSMIPGQQENIKVLIEPANVENKNVFYSSSNTDVAIVDKEGKITALSEGSAVITAVAERGPYSDAIEVTVIGE